MKQHYTNLTPAQIERLDILTEHCAEVIKTASKIKRHGFESTDPMTGQSIQKHLNRDLGALYYAQILCIDNGDIDKDAINEYAIQRDQTIKPELRHNETIGTSADVHVAGKNYHFN